MDQYLNKLLQWSVSAGISDLFLMPGEKPSCRLYGEVLKVPLEEIIVVTAQWMESFRKEILSPSEEKIYVRDRTVDCSWDLPGEEEQRFRLNFYESVRGCAAAIRPVKSGSGLDFASLNLPVILEELCMRSRGIILIAGSTGSGKSTTLGAMINFINEKCRKHILTLEDPIEILHKSKNSLISQREIDSSQDNGFAPALRGALRENPDVVVIGEMRDADTAQSAINAALTGHLVISTVHISNSVQSVERIINLFPENRRDQAAIDLGLALCAVISQRLIPCQDGKSMVPAVEILQGTPTAQKAITYRDYDALEDVLLRGESSGMKAFKYAIYDLFSKGIISHGEALKAADNPDELELLIKGMDRGTEAFRKSYSREMNLYDPETLNMRFLLRTALRKKASDLHLSCSSPPVLRLNGELVALDLPVLSPLDIERLLFSVITPRQRILLEEKRELDLALSITMDEAALRSSRFRLNAFYQRGNLGVVARVIRSEVPSVESLHLPEVLHSLIRKKQGLILVTGPTGSGKSTTLASLIDEINRTRSAKIVTLEDPIEYVHENKYSIIEQRELHSDTLGFAPALKYVLRQDPDVIMIGEMRDLETISSALTAAETGHLVFATIHTNNAPQTIDRIVDSFPSHQQNQIRLQLAGVLLAVVSQRLLPLKDGSGRIGAFEIMTGTPPIQALIRDGKTFMLQSSMETGAKDGMITMEKYIRDLFRKGLVDEECLSYFQPDYEITEDF